jgi:hypothetical protein
LRWRWRDQDDVGLCAIDAREVGDLLGGVDADLGDNPADLVISHGKEQYGNEKRVKEQQQKHKASFAVQAQLFLQLGPARLESRNERSDHCLCDPCLLVLNEC